MKINFMGTNILKKISLLTLVLFLSCLLISCASNSPTPQSFSNEDQIATIVAGTLSAIPSSTSLPTETLLPSLTNTVQPFDVYQNSEFGFECLFPLHLSFTEWDTRFDDLLFSMSFNRLEDSESNSPQKPEVSIAVYKNTNVLSAEQWLAEHIGPDAPFLSASTPIELTVNGHHAIFFDAERVMVGTYPRLLIENGQQIVSISYYTWESISLREEFLTIASSFKFSLEKEVLAVDSELYEDMKDALSSLNR
jgi:hypothetical protein